jgi:hypothetical protein
MTLHERAARAIENEPDLARVPHPVIEAVVREAVRWIAWHVPAEFDAAEMDAIDFDACESCGALIDSANPAGAHMDSDGIWLCDACHVELTPPAGVAP